MAKEMVDGPPIRSRASRDGCPGCRRQAAITRYWELHGKARKTERKEPEFLPLLKIFTDNQKYPEDVDC